jgi:hypothetical protein
MRIIKLSRAVFDTAADVRHFFVSELPGRTPPGKFRVTPDRIARRALEAGEPLVFTYAGRVVFTARAESELLANADQQQERYPNYFIVDLATLREADAGIRDLERRYNRASGADVTIARSQGWNKLPDSNYSEAIWAELGGA